MSPPIPAADALDADALYLGSLLDSMRTLALRLSLIRRCKENGTPVPAELERATRVHLTDLAEQFEQLAGLYPDLSGLEPDMPIFAGVTVAPASSP